MWHFKSNLEDWKRQKIARYKIIQQDLFVPLLLFIIVSYTKEKEPNENQSIAKNPQTDVCIFSHSIINHNKQKQTHRSVRTTWDPLRSSQYWRLNKNNKNKQTNPFQNIKILNFMLRAQCFVDNIIQFKFNGWIVWIDSGMAHLKST